MIDLGVGIIIILGLFTWDKLHNCRLKRQEDISNERFKS